MNKTSTDQLAIFGGEPLFATIRTTAQLSNPDPEAFFRLAREAFDRRLLTNNGPLVRELESRLGEIHGTRATVAFANASLAIILALYALTQGRAGDVVLPAFTFRGLPHLIRWAGRKPRYSDIEPVGHTLCPRSLAAALETDAAAVLAVNNVNGLCDIDALEALTVARGIPLLIDSVYAVGGAYETGPVGTRGSAEVFSLHASKLLNGFEGGYVTTDDEALAGELRTLRNFGFSSDRCSTAPGMNAKLNEIHAALALSCLDHMPATLDRNRMLFETYQGLFTGLPGISFADYSRAPRNHALVLIRVDEAWPLTISQTIALLRAENALVRPYYSPPLHLVDPAAAPPPHLPVTESLANRFIQMPVGELTSPVDAAALARFFGFLHHHAAEIGDRLTQRGAA